MTAPHLGPGQVVAGKYTVRSLLAFQSATATYHATDPQGGQVALKLLDPAIGQRADVMGALDRVTAETAALAQHGVQPVLDSGYDSATSAPFRVTEFLTIPSLARLLDNGPLSSEVVAAILRGLAVPLDAAHGRALFHHALKPTNVFVGPAPHYPVLVTDFGARAIREAVPTREGYAESAPWWAPEQMHPEAQLGSATDVYAVALLAFYALTGRSYWRTCQSDPPDLEGWQQEAMGHHVPVSVRAQELGRPLSTGLDGVFARALSVQPNDRPHSLAELAQAMVQLGSVVQEPHAATRPVPPQYAEAAAAAAPPPAAAAPQAIAPAYPPQSAPSGAQALAAASGAQVMAAPSAAPVAPQAAPSAPQAAPYPPSIVVAPHAAAAPPSQPAVQAMPHPGTPGLPAFPEPAPKRKGTSMVPIIIGVIGALLLGGGAVAYLFWYRPLQAGADTQASAEPVDTGAGPAGSDSATTATSGAGDAGAAETDGGDGGAAGETVDVTFVCLPGCDKVVIDGNEVEELDKPVKLLPGRHTVEASKPGYIPRKETIIVELGTPLEKKFILVRVPKASGKKPCGKFLKRCD